MKKLTFILVAVVLASCAPKYSAATQKPVSELSCAEMKDEFVKLQGIRQEAESKKGVSKENVAWAILFWPGAVVNEMDNRDVIEKVDTRLQALSTGARARGCALP